VVREVGKVETCTVKRFSFLKGRERERESRGIQTQKSEDAILLSLPRYTVSPALVLS
jgi:hypothetical protein